MTDPITRLNAALEGRYRIERELGEGGMATVYLAEDLRHERKVALKVLKPELAAVVGAERFLAEIKTTANLQHPNILPLHDSGEADGFLYYVMPYVEGESLRERIDQDHQLPVDEAVGIATNMAEALSYAHSQGVIHRDIKPANVLMLSGKPVISDFGIALAVGAAGGGRLTETGLSVGTPHYMSPEQATGDRDVDPRTDVYALGCVLHEMLTGEPPYTGANAQAVLAKILTDPAPAPTNVRLSIPPNVDAAIRRALEKLPADRFGTAQDLARALSDSGFRHGEETPAGVGIWKPWALAATGLALVSALTVGWSLLRPEPLLVPATFSITMPDSVAFIVGAGAGLTVSPDGSRVVFAAGSPSGRTQLWQRRLDQLMPVPIPDTEGGGNPRFSPDGESLAFTAESALRVVSLTGGALQTVVPDSVVDDSGGGIAWGSDDMLYFTRIGQAGIWRVSVNGGDLEQVSTVSPGKVDHAYPEVLPNARGILLTRRELVSGEIAVVSLDTGTIEPLVEGAMARYADSGHIVYTSVDGDLLAAPFDVDRLEVTGPSRILVEGVTVTSILNSYFALSRTGVLSYLPGQGASPTAQLVWVSREGDVEVVDPDWQFALPGGSGGWSLSPDAERVAVSVQVGSDVDIYIKQLPNGPFDRLTRAPERETHPAWSPDGRFVAYSFGFIDPYRPWRQRSDGVGQPEPLPDGGLSVVQGQWSANGDWMVFRTSSTRAGGGRDIVGFRPDVDSTMVPLVATPEFSEQGPAISPDGRWLAYSSNDTGQNEIYVRPLPDVGSLRVRVSTGGGVAPRWANGGDELFFVDASQRLVAAQLEAEPEFRVVDRQPLFSLGPDYVLSPGSDFYDVSADDQRFLMTRSLAGSELGEGAVPIVRQNFFEELRQVVPDN